jgi:hypothetical protein
MALACRSVVLRSNVGRAIAPLGTAATNRLIVPAPDHYDDGEIGGRMIGRGNRSTRRKPTPVPLCPPQTPHAARTRSRAPAVGSQRLTLEVQHGQILSLLLHKTNYFYCAQN